MSYDRGWPAAILGVGFVLVQMQAAQAISKAEISKTAQSITVMIQDPQNPQSSGSGVIIKREGQTYTVLTAQHVVKSSTDFKVMTPDDKQHPMAQGSIQTFPNVDLALVKFTSAEAYSVAKIGDSAQSPSGTGSFVAGFPAKTEVRSERSYYFTSGEIAANANKPLKDGYAIAYSNPTLPGMSGGPVLNEKAELIGIHGRAENAAVPQNAQIRDDIYVLKTEFNYAVPINTFLRLAPQVNKTLAFGTPSRPVTSEPKTDDYFLQGSRKIKSNDYKGAITDFDQAIRINPTFALAYSGRGYARLKLGDKQGSIADYDRAIRISPNNAVAYSNRGYARSELGDNQGAIADYDRAIQLDPKFAFNYGRRGWLRYKKFKDLPNALADMDRAIQLDPKLGIAYQSRGNIHSGLGNLQEALSDFNQAIQLEPNSAFNYYFRGLHFLKIQLTNTQRIRPNSKLTQSAIADFERSASLFKSEGNNKFYLRSLEILGKIRN
jgi:tetratricopeptide (TPR) repeat protein